MGQLHRARGEHDTNHFESLISLSPHISDSYPWHYMMWVKVIGWHCRVSRLGMVHEQEHGPAAWRKPVSKSIPPCKGWNGAGKQSLAVP